MKDRLIRAPQVVVGTGGESPNAEAAKAIEENSVKETG
jgi:hypothetical protein